LATDPLSYENVVVLEDSDIVVHPDNKSLAICVTMDMGYGSLLTCRMDQKAAMKLSKDLHDIWLNPVEKLN
jgi:hypothetical protein